jgi:glycogen debranching enzyme
MDALVNNESITSREGKAVEVQALLYNALKIMQLLANHFSQKRKAKKYSSIAEKTKVSFIEKFWNSEKACLFDVIGPEGSDCSLRPNQIVVAALDYSLIDEEHTKCVVETVWRKLWGTYGLRTLGNDDSRYVGRYLGDRFRRDYAYHNGTVWPWLIGPFVTAFLKVRHYEEKWRVFALKNFLQPLFLEETFEAGLGTISEIFDGDFPHKSTGCISQAWSIAEPLRTYVEDIMLRRPKHEEKILDYSSF